MTNTFIPFIFGTMYPSNVEGYKGFADAYGHFGLAWVRVGFVYLPLFSSHVRSGYAQGRI